MEAIVVLLALLALDCAALRWGFDSRDGRDWQPGGPARNPPCSLPRVLPGAGCAVRRWPRA